MKRLGTSITRLWDRYFGRNGDTWRSAGTRAAVVARHGRRRSDSSAFCIAPSEPIGRRYLSNRQVSQFLETSDSPPSHEPDRFAASTVYVSRSKQVLNTQMNREDYNNRRKTPPDTCHDSRQLCRHLAETVQWIPTPVLDDGFERRRKRSFNSVRIRKYQFDRKDLQL